MFGPPNYFKVENRLQRDQTAQQLWAHASCDIRRFELPVNWRFKANQQDRLRDHLILQTYPGQALNRRVTTQDLNC